MFTGLIEEVGIVKGMDAANGKITVAAKIVTNDLKIGDSIAVNGACLTVVKFAADSFTADVMPETFRRTTLGKLKTGSKVNLERAMPADGRFGGHLVSGHIDDTGKITKIKKEGNALIISIEAARSLLREIAEKGSVAIDGVSLTVMGVNDNGFAVSIIPHTRSATNLLEKKIGDSVNIETDIIAKYVARLLDFSKKPQSGGITTDLLFENGFLMA